MISANCLLHAVTAVTLEGKDGDGRDTQYMAKMPQMLPAKRTCTSLAVRWQSHVRFGCTHATVQLFDTYRWYMKRTCHCPLRCPGMGAPM